MSNNSAFLNFIILSIFLIVIICSLTLILVQRSLNTALIFILILVIGIVIAGIGSKLITNQDTKIIKSKKAKGIIKSGDVQSDRYKNELESIKLALEASENKYKNLINNIRSAIITIDKNGKIKTINKYGAELLGCDSTDEAKEHNLFKDFGIPKEDCKSLIKTLREKEFVENFETILMKKNAEKTIVRISSQLIKDSKNKIKQIDSIIRDITVQKMAEAEKSALETELFHAEKLASIGQLAAGVAHEINNPLTNISLLTTSIQRKTNDPVILEKIDKLTRQRKIAAKIVNDLLQFSRKMEPKFTKMNLSNTVLKALEEMVIDNEDLIKIENNIKDEELWVRGDPDLLRQVFINIFENAYDAIGDSGGKLIIDSRPVGLDFIEIDISDSGPGIPENILPKIFDPFYSTKIAEKGTGLGLSICHGIIRTHEGKIYAQNKKPQGASFIIQLPRWKDEV